MDAERLKEVLKLHKMWLTHEHGGKRADLRGSDLRDSDLRDSDLRDSDLRGSDLRGSDLSDSDLRDSDLRGSDLRDSDLSDSDLSDSDLSGSDLRGAKTQHGVFRGRAMFGFDGHGELAGSTRGRTLYAIRFGDHTEFSCGCFCGTEAELRKYIEDGEEEYRPSRLFALACCLKALGFSQAGGDDE